MERERSEVLATEHVEFLFALLGAQLVFTAWSF